MFKNFQSHYSKIVIFHIKIWLSGFSLKIGISSNTEASIPTWQQSTELGSHRTSKCLAPYSLLHSAHFSHLCHLAGPLENQSLRCWGTMTSLSFPGHRNPFSKSSFVTVSVTFHAFRLFIQADFQIMLLFLQF